MNKITNIRVHCSDSEWGCARTIREWHLERGWRDIGYHFIILNGYPTYEDYKNKRYLMSLDGSVECGRYLNQDLFIDPNEIGSHALGYNRNSVGICLIGKHIFTSNEFDALTMLCAELKNRFGLNTNDIGGHNETEIGIKQGKTCPNFDMNEFRERLG